MTGYLRVWSFRLDGHDFTAEFDTTDNMVRVTGHDLGQKLSMAGASPEKAAEGLARELVTRNDQSDRA